MDVWFWQNTGTPVKKGSVVVVIEFIAALFAGVDCRHVFVIALVFALLLVWLWMRALRVLLLLAGCVMCVVLVPKGLLMLL